WPNSFTRGRWWEGEPRGMKPNEDYSEEVQELTRFFKESKAYLAGDRNLVHLPFGSMENVFNGKKKVYIHVDGEKEILDALDFKTEQGLNDIVLVGANDAHKIADKIKAANVAVLAMLPHSTPNQYDEDYDFSYKNAKILFDAGILV